MDAEALNVEAETKTALLSARNLSKRYGGINALEGVSLDLFAGEIHGICGENGAGKSTFIKILGGLVHPSDGDVLIDGRSLPFGKRTDPRLISIVHQELAIIPTLSVLDNILLGMAGYGELYLRGRFRDAVRKRLDAIGLGHVGLDTLASRLSLAERQLVEIARGVVRNARVLLLDEPTATLSDAEIQRVFATTRWLRDQGTALVFVSHRLDEVFAITDRVTVFRNGRHVLTEKTSDLAPKTLVRAMIGRDIEQSPSRAIPTSASTPRIRLTGLSIPGLLNNVSLTVAPGEIVAVVGQIGSGADILLEALAGLRGRIAGVVQIDGRNVAIDGIRSAISRGIGYVAEDRAGKGVFLDASVSMNLTSSCMRRFTRSGIVQRHARRARSRELARMFQIDPGRLDSEAAMLSGGNQQKVSLGKTVALNPQLLLLNEPTRGVDIGARSEIYATLRRLADEGLSVLFYSTDLEEILDLADRVITMFRGAVVRSAVRDAVDSYAILDDILRGGGRTDAAEESSGT